MVFKFNFPNGINKSIVEQKIAEAIMSAECMFGQAKVKMYAGYAISDNKAVIDGASDVGEYVAQIFTGIMTREIGDDSFTVERVK